LIVAGIRRARIGGRNFSARNIDPGALSAAAAAARLGAPAFSTPPLARRPKRPM
jgi:hypothetical protein